MDHSMDDAMLASHALASHHMRMNVCSDSPPQPFACHSMPLLPRGPERPLAMDILTFLMYCSVAASL